MPRTTWRRSLAAAVAAVVVMLVAPAVYRAGQRALAKPRLERPAGEVRVETARLGAALRVGAALPVVVTVERPRSDIRSQPTPQKSREPLLWVGGDMTSATAGNADPGAVLPPYEREVDARTGQPRRRRRSPALSVVTGLLLGPSAVTGLSTLGHKVLGGPPPERDRSNDLSVRLHPRFAAGGAQLDVSWEF